MLKTVPLHSPSYQTAPWIGTIRTSSLLGACSRRVVHFPPWWYLVGVALLPKAVGGPKFDVSEQWAGCIHTMDYLTGIAHK